MTTPTALLVLFVRIYGAPTPLPEDMETAKRTAASILRDAGIAVRWKECRQERVAEAGCDRPVLDNEISLRFVEVDAPDHQSMGVSIIDGLSRRGTLATLYLPTIRSLSMSAHFDFGILLGRTAAHEIGHLLFGSSAHPGRGLMRPSWSPRLLHNTPTAMWSFSRAEAEELRRHLAGRTSFATLLAAQHSSN